jgi:hypothetical protein
VEYALELQAEKDLAAQPVNFAQARRNLTGMVTRLTRYGLLGNWEAGQVPVATVTVTSQVSGPIGHIQARKLAEEASGLPYTEGTAATLGAPAVKYNPEELVVAGELIPWGAAGFLSAMTQVTDTVDPLEVHHTDRAKINRAGEVLGRAANT